MDYIKSNYIQIKMMNTEIKKIKEIIESSVKVKQQILENKDLLQTVEEVALQMVKALQNGNRIFPHFRNHGG